MVLKNWLEIPTHIHHIWYKWLSPVNKKKLLKNPIQFAVKHTLINIKDLKVVFHERNSFLFDINQPSVKKDSDSFNEAMPSDDDVEIYELLGIFMLPLLMKTFSSEKVR